MIARSDLADGDVVFAAWACISTTYPDRPACGYIDKVEIVSAADGLVRRSGGGLRALHSFEETFSTEAEARQHVASTLDGIASSIRSIAETFR